MTAAQFPHKISEVLSFLSKFHRSKLGKFGASHPPFQQVTRFLVGGLNPSEKYESQLGWLATQYMGK